jgi:hypothetical protein
VTIILAFVCRLDFFTDHNVSETRSVPIIRCKAGNAPTRLDQFERPNQDHRAR